MNYLITAAGLGSRFLKESIKPPKPLIKVKGMELLLWSLKSFDFKPKDSLYIVTLKRDKVKQILLKKINLIYPQINIYWLELEKCLNGQLLTSIKDSMPHINNIHKYSQIYSVKQLEISDFTNNEHISPKARELYLSAIN